MLEKISPHRLRRAFDLGQIGCGKIVNARLYDSGHRGSACEYENIYGGFTLSPFGAAMAAFKAYNLEAGSAIGK
jgi:hypothetical protein